VIMAIVMRMPELRGLIQVAGKPIDKHALLLLMRKTFGKDIKIRKSGLLKSDKSLVMSAKLKNKIKIPSHETMLRELYEEQYP